MKFILVLLLVIFSQYSVIAQSPGCDQCYNDPVFVTDIYGGDQEACFDAECGIPVNTNSWVLLLLGVSIIAVGYVISKKSNEVHNELN